MLLPGNLINSASVIKLNPPKVKIVNKIFCSFVILGSLVLLSGCATPARVDQMVVSGAPHQRIAETPLRNNVAIRDVTGGQETNPMWKSNVGSSEFSQALEESLRTVGLLAANRQAGSHTLTVHLQNVAQPFIGLDMTVTASVNYIVAERATGREIFNRTVSVPYTAKFGDSLLGVERLKLANEGAIRTNISQLIEELFRLKIDNVSINTSAPPITSQSNEEKLKELKRLNDAGLISKDVYLAQQKAILGNP